MHYRMLKHADVGVSGDGINLHVASIEGGVYNRDEHLKLTSKQAYELAMNLLKALEGNFAERKDKLDDEE